MAQEIAQYIGVKIISAEPAYRLDGRIYPKSGAYPRAMGLEDGYEVVYEDSYVSWSPKATFEEAYRPTDGMTFGLAIEALKRGVSVTRIGWNGKGMKLELQRPDIHSKMSLPYIYMHTAQGDLVPWLASQTDMLAEDWQAIL